MSLEAEMAQSTLEGTVSLDEAKQRYAGQWVAFQVFEETSAGVVRGRVIAHHPDRRDLHRELREKHVVHAYVTFAGPVVKPGYTMVL